MFRNLKKERELIDRELAVYKQERMNKIDKDVEDFRTEKRVETNEMLRKGLKQLGEYEHEFHSTKEARGIELEKLNGQLETLKVQVEAKKELTESYELALESLKALVDAKNSEIDRLKDIIDKMIENQPEQVFVNKLR